MATNLERYRKDLDSLISLGGQLETAIEVACFPAKFDAAIKKSKDGKLKEFVAALPEFRTTYQRWYSEAKSVIRQLLPDRLDDFVRHYEKPKGRKELSAENYRIEDYLLGLTATRGSETVVGLEAAIPHVRQQLAILRSVSGRFDSSLFDVRQLVSADLFDSELDAASELAKNKFGRAAGAVAGVVLEKHLRQVCENHTITVSKKSPTIGDLNDLLKSLNIVDVPTWRFVQHLADIRNLCDHSKSADPTEAQVTDLLAGVSKITKTLF